MPRPLRTVAAFAALALAAAVLPIAWSSAEAAPDDAMYRTLNDFRPVGAKIRVEPRSYTAVRVDTDQVRAALSGAPKAGSASSTVFRVPTPAGGTERFAVQRTQVMQAGLAAAHPDISTWAGHSLDHAGTTIAMDVTPMGFHASVRGPNGQGAWYVDPAYNKPGTDVVLSYYGDSLKQQHGDRVEKEMPAIERALDRQRARASEAATVQQRVYRLALLSDPTYADYFGTANVTAEKVTLMARVNQLYNDDLAINMVLIDGTDDLNFDTEAKATGANGPCGLHPCFTNDPESTDYVEGQLAYCDSGTLVRTQTVLGQIIGAGGYDIGHIALGTAGGGVAGLGVVGSIEKGQGCTGIPAPVGDYYAVDYVAHEMGHQFGGNHTFNGNQHNCSGGNRNAGTSVEPGSGTSVMAYAGICRQDNLQLHSDPYFSQRSITEITRYTGTPAPEAVELQDVALTGFDADGETVTIDYPGSPAPAVTLVRGGVGPTAYNAANIESAVEALTGEDVTVAGWGNDPYVGYVYPPDPGYPAPLTAPDDGGFQVVFADTTDPYTLHGDHTAMDELEVIGSTGVVANVGETAEGGPAGNEGFVVTPTDNHVPVVKAPADRTLPIRTPFTLSGSGTDQDGDALTFLWEQNDVGGGSGTALVDNTKKNGPLFRVFGVAADVSDEDAGQSPAPGENHPTGSPSRTFPDLAQILAGNTNAKSGKCPKAPANDPDSYVVVPLRTVDCFSEFLPTSAYRDAMHFRLTARDLQELGGGVGHDDVTLRIDPSAGPFLVSSFTKGGSVRGGKQETVTWKVNGTTKLAKKVKIVLSTDNGKTWKKVLATTANDGKATVRFPKKKAGKAWIMIRAVDNYFFDVSDHAFKIT